MKRFAWLILVAAVIATACGKPDPAAPSLEQLQNATYDGIYDEPVTLSDGRYAGEPFVENGAARPTVVLVEKPYLLGDLDEEPGDEAVVLLSENSGGSGAFLYLSVVGLRHDEPVNLGTIGVGDRPQVRWLGLEGSWIRLDVVEQGPDDAACCPSQLSARFWRLQDGQLVEVAEKVHGTLSLAELAGPGWTLVGLDPLEPLPEDIELTIIFEDGKVAGRSGCNNYFAGIEESSPGRIKLGPAGTTRKTCAEPLMELEQRYLARLGGVKKYHFVLGKLALAWRIENGSGVLLYERSNEVTDTSP